MPAVLFPFFDAIGVIRMDRPKIRKLFPENAPPGGPKPYLLVDPFGIAPAGFGVTEKELGFLRLMNGVRTMGEISSAARDLRGEAVSVREVADLARRLEEGLLLQNEESREAYRRSEEAFRSESERPMRHHGECYPAEPAAFEDALRDWLQPPAGPGAPDFSRPGRRVTGLFAPHIDPLVAGPAYARAYKPAVEDDANDLFVILGTAHYRDVNPFILTEKPFRTPWGLVETDREFAAELRAACRADLSRDELIHKVEHSVEFQVVLLDAFLRGRRPFKIVPLLVSSFAGAIEDGANPGDDPLVADFLEALAGTLESRRGRACIVAGVDLAHLGLKFGDDEKPDARNLEDLEAADRRSLACACVPDADAFWEDVMADENARRICGVAPMYLAAKLLEGSRGEVVAYGRDHRPDEGYAVSYAGVVFRPA